MIRSDQGVKVFQSLDTLQKDFSVGIHRAVCWFPPDLLNDEEYLLNVCITSHNPVIIHTQFELQFAVVDDINSKCRGDYMGKMHGVLRPFLRWETNKQK